MKRKSNLVVLPIAFALLVSGGPRDAVSAVSSPSAKAQPPVTSTQASQSAKARPSPPTPSGGDKRFQTVYYHYNPVGKPDPFRPFVELDPKKKTEKAVVAPIFPLQRFPLEQFNLVGIASNAKRRLAIVETRDNKGKFYSLAVGTIIGLNKGKVVEIGSDRIIVSEEASGGKRRKVNNIIIRLHKGEN